MDTPTGLASLTSFKLVVADLDRAAAFYKAVCGFEDSRNMQFAVAGRSFKDIILRKGKDGQELTIMVYDDGKVPTPGAVVLTYSTDDLAAFRQRALEAGGTEVSEERSLRLGSWNARISDFADPDGNVLQVLQTVEATDKDAR